MIDPADRFNDAMIERAIDLFESILAGARNSNQAAEDALQAAYTHLKGTTPHMHAAGTIAGHDIDKCADCGMDLRDPIHSVTCPATCGL